MIACKFSHNCSFSVTPDHYRISGMGDDDATVANGFGRWSQTPFEMPVAAINLRECVVHVWTDAGNVYLFDADGKDLRIIKIS